MYFSRFANHVGEDRRHLFVTPFCQLRVGEKKFAVVVYCCNWKNAPKLYTQIIGAANTAAPALFEILTQFLIVSMCFHH
jgi:hypothetical protein